jgi:hypothetical protein
MKSKPKSKAKVKVAVRAKKRPGRHRLPEEERRTEVMTLKFSKHEKGLVLAAAKASGNMAPYVWARALLVKSAETKLGLGPTTPEK